MKNSGFKILVTLSLFTSLLVGCGQGRSGGSVSPAPVAVPGPIDGNWASSRLITHGGRFNLGIEALLIGANHLNVSWSIKKHTGELIAESAECKVTMPMSFTYTENQVKIETHSEQFTASPENCYDEQTQKALQNLILNGDYTFAVHENTLNISDSASDVTWAFIH